LQLHRLDSGAFGRADYQEEEVDTMSEPNGFRSKRNEVSGDQSAELISASKACGAGALSGIAYDRARARFLLRFLRALCMVILPVAAAGLTGCAGMDSAKSPAVAMQIMTTALPAATVQSNYLATLAVRGGRAPYSWSAVSGQLPAGLTLNLSTGTITGTPASSGAFSFTARVQDANASVASTRFSLVVSPKKSLAPPNPAPLQIGTTILPTGAVQNTYVATLGVTGGAPPYSWSTIGGQLPTGLTLNLATGAISGTPALAGAFSFMARVQDSQAASASTGVSLDIASAPAPAISVVLPDSGSIGGGTSVTISGSNFRPGAVVRFGGSAASVVSVSAGQIQALTPAQSSGSVTVTVENSDVQTATAAKAFRFVPPAPNGLGEAAQSADAFVDSAAVNVHLHYTDTVYASNFAAVENALKGLGVRHIRDGLIDTTWTPYYDRLNELGRSGIKSDLVTSANQSAALLAAYPQRVPDSLEAYEAPNEYDSSGDPNWSATLNSFVVLLHGAVKSGPVASQFPIYGPSLTQQGSYPKMAPAAPFFDSANLHNYLGGRNPGTSGWGGNGYGSIDWNLALANTAWPGKPVVTTETGYINDLSKANSVPEDISGKYLPRLLLEQWLHGIHRTYIYELVDIGTQLADNGFGLLHNDFSPKPGYNAIKSLLGLLTDPGPAFPLGNLDYKLSGNVTNVHHLLLEKRDGTFYLALWIEQPGYDVNAKQPMSVAAQTVSIETTQSTKISRCSLDGSGNLQTTALGAGQTRTLDVNDQVTILQISQ
jgi:IPT/TIG domain/Putative Ig domain